MKLGLTHQNNQFGFVVVSERSNTVIYDSTYHSYLIPFIKSGYKYAWQAQRDGNKLLKDYSHHFCYSNQQDMEPRVITEVSANEMLENHYRGIYDGVEDKVRSSVGESEEIKDKTYNELKIIINEMKSVIGQLKELDVKRKMTKVLTLFTRLRRKYFPEKEARDKKEEEQGVKGPPLMPVAPAAPNQLMASAGTINLDVCNIDKETKRALMEHYGEKTCEAIENRHAGAHYVFGNIEKDTIVICDKNNRPIVCIGVNDKLNVDKITPIGKVNESNPYHTVEFYQKYWKPIVDKIGHFYLDDSSLLILPNITPLPDAPKGDDRSIIKGLNINNKKEGSVEITFKGSSPSWFFKNAKTTKIEKISQNYVSKYTELDYTNAKAVKCIDPQLKSICGRTGSIKQIIPNEDFIEVDVDFGRGIEIVRLTEKQLEIVL